MRIGHSRCVLIGGPAGMVLSPLLARAGVEMIALEEHADILCDFGGDTVHPSTMENWTNSVLGGMRLDE